MTNDYKKTVGDAKQMAEAVDGVKRLIDLYDQKIRERDALIRSLETDLKEARMELFELRMRRCMCVEKIEKKDQSTE